jgi:hypothetical protein
MTQDRGGMVHFEPLGSGVVKLIVHGKSGMDGRGDWIELILDSEELAELAHDVHKARQA